MPSFPDQAQVQRACRHTWDALGMPVHSSLSQEEAGVFLKYLLLEGLESGAVRYWRARRQTDATALLRRRLEGLLAAIQQAARPGGELALVAEIKWDVLSQSLTSSPYYRQRLIDIAREAVLSERLAPEQCLRQRPATRQELSAALSGTWNHAVIFASPIFFVHEFYPLAVDAYVHDCERHGKARTNVLGASMDWLTDNGQLERVLYADFARGRLVETDVASPVRPDSTQFICLGSQEQERHRALAERIPCTAVNPPAPSSLADDKAATLAGWSALDLEVPAYREITQGDSATALAFLERFAEIVVKPGRGTEGENVTFFQRGQARVEAELQRHLERCWEKGPAIAQQRRDGIFFRDPVSGRHHSLALRFNLALDRMGHYRLESGYAQLGRDEHSPAACGRGGRIVPMDEALSGLTCGPASASQPIRLASKDWSTIRQQAERAAGLFRGLMLMGLDVLLDRDEHGNLLPVFLEANPRPAGLSHSRLLNDDPWAPARVGVSLNLWGYLERTRSAQPVGDPERIHS